MTNTASLPSTGAARQVACVVRATGERTAAVCRELLARELPAAPLTTVGGRPFPETLADSLRAGVVAGCRWTLCVDADVLPLEGAVTALLAEAEALPEAFLEIQPLVLDRFFGGWRPAGVHLYRTRHLERALTVLARMEPTIRPETALLLRLAEEGLDWKQSAVEFGLHDFAQWPRDVYRKCFVHARKHAEVRPALERFWRAREAEPDFAVALEGLAAGTTHAGAIALDASAPYLARAASADEGAAPLAGPTDVAAWLDTEEQALLALGPEIAPVWDWVESAWGRADGALRSVTALVRTLVEAGVTQCVVDGVDTRTRLLVRLAARWGVAVVGVVASGRRCRRSFAGVPLLDERSAAALGLARVRRTATGRFVAVGIGEERAAAGAVASASNDQVATALVRRVRAAGVKRVLVYGAGALGAAVAKAAAGATTIDAFLESEPARVAQPPTAAPVLTPEDALRGHPGVDVVIASQAHAEAMVRRIRMAGRTTGRRVGRIWLLEAV